MSEQAKPEITPGPWELCVLDMPLADVPEYVRQCIDASGGADYHFVRAKNADGEWVDVCHVGNGPMGNFNGHYIAQLPALLDEITALRAALDQERADNAKLRAFAQEIVEEIYGEGLVKQMANANGLLNDDGQPTALLSGRGEGGG